MKVDLCVFSYRSGSALARQKIDLMVEYSRQQCMDVSVLTFGNALIHRARNEALCTTRSDTAVLFIDDDMSPEKDALVRLADAKRPVISALCTTRTLPVHVAAKVYNRDTGDFGWIERINLSKVVDGPFAPGTGFLLMNRETISAVMEYYLSARDWQDEQSAYLSRLHVRAETREKERRRKEALRRVLWHQQHYARIFDFPVNDDELQLGEDISLGRKLLNLGIPVSIDGSTPVGHLGEYAYSVYDMLDAEMKQVA